MRSELHYYQLPFTLSSVHIPPSAYVSLHNYQMQRKISMSIPEMELFSLWRHILVQKLKTKTFLWSALFCCDGGRQKHETFRCIHYFKFSIHWLLDAFCFVFSNTYWLCPIEAELDKTILSLSWTLFRLMSSMDIFLKIGGVVHMKFAWKNSEPDARSKI